MNATRAVESVAVTEGDHQVASHVGLHLLGDLADRSGLSSAYSGAVPWAGERAPGHDRGRLLAQVAVMLAGGGECVTDMAALRDQPELFGEVASAPTIWRAVHEVDAGVLDDLRQARADARAKVWVAVDAPEEVILDIDAALVEVHSDNKERAAASYKGGYGFHPMFCFADHTGEAMAGILRSGNATANSGADQMAVVDLALAQLPPAHRAGHHEGAGAEEVLHPIVVRADTAGYVAAVPQDSWCRAIDVKGEPRHAGEVAELEVDLDGWPPATRAICRREQAHPGAQLRLWDSDGWRHQVTLTNSGGDMLALELRQRLHARVENSIKALRDTGLDRMPFTSFAANEAWLELVLAAADLLAWLRLVCLDGELARAEPKTLRYRLLHTAARIVRRARRVILRLPEHWPWAPELAGAYRRLAALTA